MKTYVGYEMKTSLLLLIQILPDFNFEKKKNNMNSHKSTIIKLDVNIYKYLLIIYKYINSHITGKQGGV